MAISSRSMMWTPSPSDPAGTVEVGLTQGRHRLSLLGVAGQCAVAPGIALDLDISPGSTTRVAFNVTCPATGARVKVTTSGPDLDLDGYNVVVDGSDRGVVSPNDTMLIPLDPGSQTISLTGLTPGCAIDGPSSRTVTIVVATVVPVEFAVVCTATRPEPPSMSGVLAFTSGHGNLAITQADGSKYRELTTLQQDQVDDGAAWSPVGIGWPSRGTPLAAPPSRSPSISSILTALIWSAYLPRGPWTTLHPGLLTDSELPSRA